MTTRLSNSSLAGTARTLVAVGTCSDCSMLATTRAAAPRSWVVLAPVAASCFGSAGAAALGSSLASGLVSALVADGRAAGFGASAATGGVGLFSAAGLSAGVPASTRAAGVGRFWVEAGAAATAPLLAAPTPGL